MMMMIVLNNQKANFPPRSNWGNDLSEETKRAKQQPWRITINKRVYIKGSQTSGSSQNI